jgi:integrase
VATIDKPGMHADGDGLYLVVDVSGAKRWAFIFQWSGKRKELGLGKLAAVSLAEARDRAAEARRLVGEGRNPIEVRKTAQAAREAGAITFGSFAEEYLSSIESQFRNSKHKAQWRMTLSVQRGVDGQLLDAGYCLSLRNKRLDEIDTEQVLAILQPIWLKKNETASRLRGRLERVLDAAKVKGYRSGENPARWRGHLDKLLPKRKKLSHGHHPALPYAEAPGFMAKIALAGGMGAKALRFTMLTASRTGETRLATWGEFNFEAKVWTVPAARMKAGREHRVPLTGDSLTIVEQLYETRIGDFVFPGQRPNVPISEGTMTKAMVTAGAGAYTVHGMRSTFRDWISEATQFPDSLAEAALAHVVGDETERAYKRGDALAKRRKVMEAWDRYLLTPAKGNVVPLSLRRAN